MASPGRVTRSSSKRNAPETTSERILSSSSAVKPARAKKAASVESMLPEYSLFGIENPLLDISAHVNSALLEKYELKANDAILAEEKHKGVYKDLEADHEVWYGAGGAAQNTLRGAQWLLPPKSTVYVGAVGKDANAEKLRSAAHSEGLRTEYMVDETLPTGVCGVLVTGQNRSLVTDLQAANSYKVSHLQSPEIWSLVENAKYFYVGGFFLTVSVESANLIAKHAAETGKVFAMNLSAPFIPQFFKEPLDGLAPYWDLIFGNESEALAYAESHGLETKEIVEIAKVLSKLPKVNETRKRTVIITQGRDPTIVAIDGEVTVFPVVEVSADKIVDTNGAGDAFTGGYLAAYVLGKDVKESVRAGQYVASEVIQQSGPTYPAKKNFEFN
ncbi:adenosine kinase [Physocladia obscura]|uniref:Adenosine kinase n=1 Tax=Physocladia obscura TaxID=109957 RepID=A0AAD5XE86_9FUNG|nr:adenosine kinase [Physocladia obscura]